MNNERANYGEWMSPTYTVIGARNDDRYPYLNDLHTLREAIDKARFYPTLERNGACTRICRNFRFKSLEPGYSHVSGRSHEWYVYPNGEIELIEDRIGKRVGVDDWFDKIRDVKRTPRKNDSLKSKLRDLELMARAVGLEDAIQYLKETQETNMNDKELDDFEIEETQKLMLVNVVFIIFTLFCLVVDVFISDVPRWLVFVGLGLSLMLQIYLIRRVKSLKGDES